jgi:hypothetical protein
MLCEVQREEATNEAVARSSWRPLRMLNSCYRSKDCGKLRAIIVLSIANAHYFLTSWVLTRGFAGGSTNDASRLARRLGSKLALYIYCFQSKLNSLTSHGDQNL